MNLTAFDHYARLGIATNATSEEIRRAYRNQARIHHPDVAANKTHAEEIFKRLHEAYTVLMDRNRRSGYDAGLRAARNAAFRTAHARATPQATAAAAPAPPPRRRKKPERPVERPDLDVESDLEISLEDAVHGATYVLTLRQNDAARRRPSSRIDLHTCRVEIPGGVYEGQRLRLRGLGYADGDSIGNLFLTIRYARQTRFRMVGTFLVTELILTPWEAALGGRKRLETLDGMADLHIPPGTQPGQRLRLAGHGVPLRDGNRGDLQITVKLRVPTVISQKERQLWQAIASQHR